MLTHRQDVLACTQQCFAARFLYPSERRVRPSRHGRQARRHRSPVENPTGEPRRSAAPFGASKDAP
eukprot:10803357-Alexandrium_andersonii.AAC.1